MARQNFVIRGGANFSGINQALTNTQRQLQTFQTSVNGTMKKIGAILGSLAVGKLVKDSTQMAMGVESALDNISRNMGSSAGAFQEWVETQSKALGMAKADAYKYGSTFSNLLGSFTSSAKEASDQTQELMRAAAIIASKTGREYDDVANRIRSGMLGSTEAIEDLGVYTNISMIESTNAFKKFAGNKSWAQLDFKVQQQIRLAAILEQTYARYGDTLADTTATRQARFMASLKNIQLSLGQAFLPIYNAILPALTKMADALGNVVNMMAQFSQALFGKASSLKQTQAQAGAVSELGDATEKAGKQAKKSVAGFDEINSLSKADAGGGAGSSGASALTSVDDGTGGIMGEVSAKAQEMADKFKNAFKGIDFSNIQTALNNLKLAMEPLTATLFSGLKWAVDNVFIPLAKITIEHVIPAFLNTLALAMRGLNTVLQNAKPLIIGVATAFISWKAIEFANYVKYIGAITRTTGFTALYNAVTQLTVVGFAGMKTQLVALLGKMKLFALNLLTSAKNAGILLVEMVKQIATLATNSAAWVWNKTVLVASTVAQKAMTVATAAWNAVCVIATTVTTALGTAIAFLTSPIGLVILAIGAAVTAGVLLYKNWDTVKTKALEIFGTVRDTISNSLGTVKTKFSEITSYLSGTFSTAWSKVWNGAKTTFKGVFDSLYGIVKTPLNLIIGAINTVIKGLNKISISIPDIPGLPGAGKKFGVNIPNVPKLAKGAIIDSPTLAMVGEAGKEAVMPLENNTGWITDLANQISSGMGGGNSTIIVKIGEETIAEKVVSTINRQSRISGKTIITV